MFLSSSLCLCVYESFAKCKNKKNTVHFHCEEKTLAVISKALYFLYLLVGESFAGQIFKTFLNQHHCIDEELGFCSHMCYLPQGQGFLS